MQGRPKREIHPPPPKDLPYADAPRKARKGKKKDDGTVEQLKYCGKILTDFVKQKKYWPAVQPFMEPVGKILSLCCCVCLIRFGYRLARSESP